MASRPGEENVATLFGDVHYFYGPPTQNPPHHRFDKGSYVYLFENAHEGRARIEIANQPGTDDQDAFDGYLDSTRVRYSYKQQCVVGLTVGNVSNLEEWHLPTFDPRNENKYHYKLHSLDIYFWTPQDALQFLNGVRRWLPVAQVEVFDEPGPPPRQQQYQLPPQQQQRQPVANDPSGLVQKLENVAISGDGGNNGAPSFAPPPLSAVSPSKTEPQAFVPMAYNPAAPAAPEAIRHREKTPPPEDAGVNPLHMTLAQDATTPFSPGLAPTGMAGPLSPGIPPPQFAAIPGAPSFPGPPAPPPPPPSGVASPGLPPTGFGQHPHPGLARAHTVPVAGFSSPLASPYASNFPGSPGFAPQQQQQLHHHHTPTPPASSTPGLPPPPPPPSQSAPSGMGSMDYSIHQQMYRPSDNEMEHKYKHKADEKRKLEQHAGRLEGRVTSVFRKIEKKLG